MAFTRTGIFFSANSVDNIFVNAEAAALAVLYANCGALSGRRFKSQETKETDMFLSLFHQSADACRVDNSRQVARTRLAASLQQSEEGGRHKVY